MSRKQPRVGAARGRFFAVIDRIWAEHMSDLVCFSFGMALASRSPHGPRALFYFAGRNKGGTRATIWTPLPELICFFFGWRCRDIAWSWLGYTCLPSRPETVLANRRKLHRVCLWSRPSFIFHSADQKSALPRKGGGSSQEAKTWATNCPPVLTLTDFEAWV